MCALVTEKKVFIAGDIFQSIFEERKQDAVEPNFLLSNCYRTDPKTLMFAQAIGMGLFEEQKLWWLDDKEWELCGYKILESTDIDNAPYFFSPNAHKGQYGRTLVIAGSKDIYGACFFCALSAFKSGAGLVKIVTHENNRYTLQHDLPEAMFSFYDKEWKGELFADIETFDTIVIGPGLSKCDIAVRLVEDVIKKADFARQILVFDADALNILSENNLLFNTLCDKVKTALSKTVFTPHEGELKRLAAGCGCSDPDAFAEEFARKHVSDALHYFVGAGALYGATYSYGMCYWEEQHWHRTKTIHASEFFHGMFEIVGEDTPVTVYMGEDSQRCLTERVVNFLEKVCKNYTVIDAKDYNIPGIDEEYRKNIGHLIMHAVNNRIDVHMEAITGHDMTIRRYYRKLDY